MRMPWGGEGGRKRCVMCSWVPLPRGAGVCINNMHLNEGGGLESPESVPD